ncbi:hypothetical protein GS601_16405 [Myxacorys almedinensis A]|uniref:Uncharacterized protein n=1 Tax=Myxacorys almedinensis A TaxID=2690445 RepID=A0A8J7Z2I8_9CYAN|nr:hypothetical protein [Myxacorys almedinensis A]
MPHQFHARCAFGRLWLCGWGAPVQMGRNLFNGYSQQHSLMNHLWIDISRFAH